MKKAFLWTGLLAFLAVSFCFAFEPVWISSNTASADTTQNLCIGKNYLINTTTVTTGNHGIFHGACINQGSVGGILTVYNSSGSANSAIAAIATTTMTPCSFFDVGVSSGLTYTNSATANATILYQCW